jgi:penicillin-binding protein activator
MRKTRSLLWIAGMLVLIVFNACGTKVEYGDPGAVETLTVDFGSTDLQMIAGKMVQSMLSSPVIQEQPRPVVQVASVQNKTSEHIDTQAITDKIRTTLIQSGKVRFSAAESRNEVIDELEYQRGSGYVDAQTQKKVGKQVGADFLLTGEISSIAKHRGKVRDVYYKINLNLVNLETGLIDWADEKEIRKGER